MRRNPLNFARDKGILTAQRIQACSRRLYALHLPLPQRVARVALEQIPRKHVAQVQTLVPLVHLILAENTISSSPGGESARVAAEEACRHKPSKQQGQSRANSASTILQTARCMKVQVNSAELSSWAKIVHWLRGPNAVAIVEMFGELTVPHFTCDVFGQA